MPKHPSEAAASLIADKLVAIRAYAQPYAQGRVADRGVILLAKYHVRVCTSLIGFLATLDRSDEDEFADDLAKIYQAVPNLARMTRFFTVSDGPLFQSGVLKPWINTVRAVHENVEVIIRAQSAYEFEGRLEIHKILDKWLPVEISRVDVFRGFPKYFLVFNIPTVESWNLLIQTLIAHEVGHFIFLHYQLETISYYVVLEQSSRIDAAWADSRAHASRAKTLQEFREWCSAVISSRFKELMSDIFAAQIVGPCILPALRDFALPGYALDFTVDDGDMFFYPSLRKRFSTLLEKLAPFWSGTFRFVKETDDKDILADLRHDLRKWRFWLHRNASASSAGFEFIDAIVDDCVGRALAQVAGDERRWEYHPDQFKDDVFELYNRIQDKIPPNEILGELNVQGRPAAWQSVLNAAWLHYCYNSDDKLDAFRFEQTELSDGSATERHSNLCKLNDFMTRSLEMAIVHKEFVEQKKRLGGILDDVVGQGD